MPRSAGSRRWTGSSGERRRRTARSTPPKYLVHSCVWRYCVAATALAVIGSGDSSPPAPSTRYRPRGRVRSTGAGVRGRTSRTIQGKQCNPTKQMETRPRRTQHVVPPSWWVFERFRDSSHEFLLSSVLQAASCKSVAELISRESARGTHQRCARTDIDPSRSAAAATKPAPRRVDHTALQPWTLISRPYWPSPTATTA